MSETPETIDIVSTAEATRAGARLSILLIGVDREAVDALRADAREGWELVEAVDLDRAWQSLTSRQIGVLCLGSGLHGEEARAFLERLYDRLPEHRSVNLVLNAGPDLGAFAELIGDDRIYYLTERPPSPAEVAALVRGAARRRLELGEGAAAAASGHPGGAELLRRLAFQEDPADVAELVAEAAGGAVLADRAYCLLYDPVRETLWVRDPVTLEKRHESAAVGLVSFVLRSGLAVQKACIGEDPRHDAEADDPPGSGRERFLAVPVTAAGDRRVAVLSVVRDGDRPEFTAAEREHLEQLATQAAPYLDAQLPSRQADDGDVRQRAGYDGELYRSSMVDRLFRSVELQSDPLRISPVWSRICYWVLVAALVGFFVYSLIGEIDEYATGTAVVQIVGRTDLTARVAGTVTAVEVESGQPVRPGQVLLRFNDERELAELDRIEREFKLQLINRLRDPTDPAAEQALISHRAQRELARARLKERYIQAPTEATVSEVRVRPGQYLQPGQILLSLVGETTRAKLTVMLPGHYRPLIRPGMPMRFEVSGYRYAYQKLEVASVGEEVVGPAEVHRYLGPAISDAVLLSGPVVLVEADLPSSTFEADGNTYRYHDGMNGAAEVRIRSEKILLVLIPALKSLRREAHG